MTTFLVTTITLINIPAKFHSKTDTLAFSQLISITNV